MTTAVPMTYATGLGPLPRLLEERGGSKAVSRAFAGEGLPLALVSDRAHRVPLVAMVSLFDKAARLAGDPLFGLDVGSGMSPLEYGRWVRFALQAPTLSGAISRILRCVTLHQVGGTFVLRPREGGRFLWAYRQETVVHGGALQHDDHVLPPMIRFVRAYCGAGWKPCWIETRHADPAGATAREDLTGTHWRFRQNDSGIVLPVSALRASRAVEVGRRTEPAISSAEILAELRQSAAEPPAVRISAILALRLLDGLTDIDGAARMAGLGRRSLQRVLDREGVNYRALLDRVRMCRARALILETDESLTGIALQLGYSDPAHFTRAFRRHFGARPSDLRKAVAV